MRAGESGGCRALASIQNEGSAARRTLLAELVERLRVCGEVGRPADGAGGL